MRVQRIALEHHCDTPLVGPQTVDGSSAERDRPLILRLEAGDDADKRRLPAAGRTDQRQEFAVPNREIDPVQDARVSERL
jgi:hypothetical protein